MAAVTTNAPLRRDRTTAPRIPASVGSMAHLHSNISALSISPDLSARISAAAAAQNTSEAYDRNVTDAPGFEAKADSLKRCQVRQSNDLCQAWAGAEHEVATFPVNSAADLHAKIAFMVDKEMGNGTDWLPELLVDAQRLAGRA